MNKQEIIDHNPFIIAEIGSNFTTLQDCKSSIWEAKNAGAHAAKFQLFTHNELYGYNDSSEPISDTLILNGILPRNWIPDLKRECQKAHIHFMCSAFSVDGYKFINEYVDIHKLASSELTHLRIVDYLSTTGKPVLFSTGGSVLDEIKFIYDRLGHDQAIPMYCVANYPARELNLYLINKLSNQLETKVGFSDHSVDIMNIPSHACEVYGAIVIEKHFTAIPHIKTPDQPHSLNPKEFRLMVDSFGHNDEIRSAWVPEENEFVLKHKRRLMTLKEIKPGDILIEGDNYAPLRSKLPDTVGTSALNVEYFHGKKATKHIPAYTGLPRDAVNG